MLVDVSISDGKVQVRFGFRVLIQSGLDVEVTESSTINNIILAGVEGAKLN